MKLTARLQAIAGMVPHGSRLADIGSDHAYLHAGLLEQGKIVSAIATDIAEGPLKVAKNSVAMKGLGKKNSAQERRRAFRYRKRRSGLHRHCRHGCVHHNMEH